MSFEDDKIQFKQLKPEIQKEIINNLKLSKKNKLDLVKAIVYYIAPHDQLNINDTEACRLERIQYLIERFDIDVNEKVPEFFTSFLCFSIYFRQQLIANYFILKGANINFIDCLELSPINYLCSKIIIGEKKHVANQLNELRDSIDDKVMFSTLEMMMNHQTQKLEYFHKNKCSNYCLYDAYTTSQIYGITNGEDYHHLYEILAYKIQEINTNDELSSYYAVEISEFRNNFSADINKPTFFNEYKKMNKKNIIEYILAGDEPGALYYLKKNPKCINECDIDLQSPLQWAIYMSQEDKPVKFFKLINELIQAGSDPDHKNISGYNCIELAAWYDYCIDQKNGIDKYTLLNTIFNSLEQKDNIKFKKYTSDIEKYKKLMEYNHSIQKKKNMLNNINQETKPIINLKINKNYHKIEKLKIEKELKLMANEDIRQLEIIDLDTIKKTELSDRIAYEILLDENFIENKKTSNNIPKSKKQKQKEKNNKQALKEARLKAEKQKLKEEETIKLRAKLKAQEEALLKSEKEAILKAEEQALLKSEKEAILKAEEQEILKAKEEEILKAKEQEILKAKEEEILKAKEQEALLKAKEHEILKAKEEETLKAKEHEILKAKEEETLKAKEQEILKAKEEETLKAKRKQNLRNKKKKTKNNNYDNYSCNSDITSSESFVNEEQNIVPSYVPFYSNYQLSMMENNPHGQWIYVTNPWFLQNRWVNPYQQAQPMFYY